MGLVLNECEFRAEIVSYIMDGRPEHAVKLLSEYYEVSEPGLRVGTVKRHRKVLACYVEKEKRIYISRSQLLTDPFVILHEFYHHLRASSISKSRQVEKRADLFALNFIRDFKRSSVTSTG
jgi:Zn-dependent peptidase ImmA (M78 family)